MAGLSDFDLAAFVEASCRRHGVAVKITDSGVHSKVALLLSGRAVRSAAERGPDRRATSDAPDEIHPLRVERSTTNLAGCDHSMVQNSTNDGVLAGEIEIRPLSA